MAPAGAFSCQSVVLMLKEALMVIGVLHANVSGRAPLRGTLTDLQEPPEKRP